MLEIYCRKYIWAPLSIVRNICKKFLKEITGYLCWKCIVGNIFAPLSIVGKYIVGNVEGNIFAPPSIAGSICRKFIQEISGNF